MLSFVKILYVSKADSNFVNVNLIIINKSACDRIKINYNRFFLPLFQIPYTDCLEAKIVTTTSSSVPAAEPNLVLAKPNNEEEEIKKNVNVEKR